jgi:putative DNA primase/helicase
MNDNITEFKKAILAAGLTPPEIIADGEIHRFAQRGDNGYPCWYVLNIDTSTDLAHATYGCWKRGLKKSWQSKSAQNSSSKELIAMKSLQRASMLRRKKDDHLRHKKAALSAVEMWESAPCEAYSGHAYLQSKKVKSYGLKVGMMGELLVPIRNNNEKLVGLQRIFPNGDKYFIKGTPKKGNYFEFGALYSDNIFICEGYATGASIYEAYKGLVVVAFDANNLKPVSINIRKKYPEGKITIAADNDTPMIGETMGTGEIKAREAMKAIDATFIMPKQVGFDFNDLANDGVKL